MQLDIAGGRAGTVVPSSSSSEDCRLAGERQVDDFGPSQVVCRTCSNAGVHESSHCQLTKAQLIEDDPPLSKPRHTAFFVGNDAAAYRSCCGACRSSHTT